MPKNSTSVSLTDRTGLPDALRALVVAYPRNGWEENPAYSRLIRFWLDRHMMFRQILDHLDKDTESALDGNQNPDSYKRRVSQLGGRLINELHGHHQIEDMHYFPTMALLDQRTAMGFDILDKDHQLLDEILSDLADTANGVLRFNGAKAGFVDTVAAMKDRLNAFRPMLNRHLIDEEELVVPVLLKYDPPQFR